MTATELRWMSLSWLAVFFACGGPETQSPASSTGTSSPAERVETLKVPGGRASNPRFSPDNQQIAFLRQDNQSWEVAVMKADGSQIRILAKEAKYLTDFAWKADGSEFLATMNYLRWVSASSGTTRAVSTTRNFGFAAMAPDLSPDGKTLIYAVNGSSLFSVDLTATDMREVKLDLVGSAPRFSPDGKTLAYVTRNGMLTLYDFSAKTSKELFDVKNFFSSLDWFREGKALVVSTDRGIEKVTLGEPFDRKVISSRSALTLDLSSDDLQLVYSVNGASDLYVLKGF